MLSKPIPIIRKTLCLLLLAQGTVTAASAQQSSCSVKIDQLLEAPELRGFHLGMTYDQVKARVPPIQFGVADQCGVAKTSINPSFSPQVDKASFADVRPISLDFMDGKLVTLWIGYESTFKWQKLDEFGAGMSKSLKSSRRVAAKPRRTTADVRRFLSVGVFDRRPSRHSHPGCSEREKVAEASRVTFKKTKLRKPDTS